MFLAAHLVSVFLFSSPLLSLHFSFKSASDGYVYPHWKAKGDLPGHFYEDAVVVGKDFVALGDGVGGTQGYSGIWSNYVCLKLAKAFENWSPIEPSKFSERIQEATKDASEELELSKGQADMNEVATTLVFAKIKGDRLHTAVTGDSGYSIYRYDKLSNTLKLRYRSKELIHEFNTPYYVGSDGKFKSAYAEHGVEEGDILVTASDGVLDVLPSSFISVATNFLVKRMLEKARAKTPVKDYDYDLESFVESYIQNLTKLSKKLQIELVGEILGGDDVDPDVLPSIPVSRDSIAKEENQEEKPEENNDEWVNLRESVNDFDPYTNDIYEQIYSEEIINIFDPSSSNKAFKKSINDEKWNFLLNQNAPEVTPEESEETIKKLDDLNKQKISHDLELDKNWDCSDIEDLTFPIHPTALNPEDFHDFRSCVGEMFGKLPPGTTPKKIAEVFNSRYFARNIGIAVKFISKDTRVKVDDFLMKYYYDEDTKSVIFPKDGIPYEEDSWVAKVDDVSIAAAALVKESNFDSNNNLNYNGETNFYDWHLTSLKEFFLGLKQSVLKASESVAKKII